LTQHDALSLSRWPDVVMRALRRVGFVFCLIVCGRTALLKGSQEKPCIQLDMDHGK
jgi:hypothetical protein